MTLNFFVIIHSFCLKMRLSLLLPHHPSHSINKLISSLRIHLSQNFVRNINKKHYTYLFALPDPIYYIAPR